MTFLTPIPALLTAAVTIPALLLLYFLKLRRRPLRVPTTLLWLKSIEDLQVNVPFQRLRLTLLFMLQFTLLLLLLLALARPALPSDYSDAGRLIIIIDRSASMNARDAEGGTARFDLAIETARRIIDESLRSDHETRIMLIVFGRTASVVSGFESNRSALESALASIRPTDEPGDLESAVRLANAFALTASDDAIAAADVLLLSDGVCVRGPDETSYNLRAASFRFVRIGPGDEAPIDNLGIVSFSAQRDGGDPLRLRAFLRIANASEDAVEARVQVRLDDEVIRTILLDVPAADHNEAPGEATTTLDLHMPGGGLLTAVITRSDALEADNTAALYIPAPRALSVMLISPEGAADPFLRGVLEATESVRLQQIDAGRLASLVAADAWDDPEARPDLIVLDRVTPSLEWPIATLVFGAEGPSLEIREPRAPARRLASWDRRHPILRHVEFDDLIFTDFGGYRIDTDHIDRFDILASSVDGPVIVAARHAAAPRVYVGFELMHSNWPAHVGLVVFIQNLLDAAALGGRLHEGLDTAPGVTLQIPARADAEAIEIEGRRAVRVGDEADRLVSIQAPPRVGVYAVRGAEPPFDRIAVNLLSLRETDIRPRSEVLINARTVEAVASGRASPRELWHWFAAAALVILIIEWLVYSARVRG